MKVRIKSNINKTEEEYGLDESGIMKSMVGNVFKISDITNEYDVRIRGSAGGYLYTFSSEDIIVISYDDTELNYKPQSFIFNPNQLDI